MEHPGGLGDSLATRPDEFKAVGRDTETMSMKTSATGEARRLNGWVVEDRGASARVAGAWLTSLGVLASASGVMMLAMHRAWVGAAGPGIVAVLVGFGLTGAGWSCLRRADVQRARLMVPTTFAARRAVVRPSSTSAARRRVDLLPMAALTTGR